MITTSQGSEANRRPGQGGVQQSACRVDGRACRSNQTAVRRRCLVVVGVRNGHRDRANGRVGRGNLGLVERDVRGGGVHVTSSSGERVRARSGSSTRNAAMCSRRGRDAARNGDGCGSGFGGGEACAGWRGRDASACGQQSESGTGDRPRAGRGEHRGSKETRREPNAVVDSASNGRGASSVSFEWLREGTRERLLAFRQGISSLSANVCGQAAWSQSAVVWAVRTTASARHRSAQRPWV